MLAVLRRMQDTIEAHGGTVEKFIGDAVMAVFGVPSPTRTTRSGPCRAAAEMRDASRPTDTASRARIGVNTGEVVTAREERLVDRRRRQRRRPARAGGRPGEILIGEATLALVRGAVDIRAGRAARAEGQERTACGRTGSLAVREAPERSHDAPLRRPGPGAARPARGVAADGGRSSAASSSRSSATRVSGSPASSPRSPPGRRASSRDAACPTATGSRTGRSSRRSTAGGSAVRPGSGGGTPFASGRERGGDERRGDRLGLPQAARGAGAARGRLRRHPVGRGNVPRSDRRPRAAGVGIAAGCVHGPPGAPRTAAELADDAPVGAALGREVGELVGELPGGLGERIAAAAGGNPLFLTEMLAMAGERAEVEVPPTLRALLAARLDQLDEPDRRVLERGAVEGEVFHRGAVRRWRRRRRRSRPGWRR